MAISFAVNMCNPPLALDTNGHVYSNPGPVHKLAVIADFLLGVSMLVVGILALTHTISLPPAAAYSLTAAGGVYLSFKVLGCLNKRLMKSTIIAMRQEKARTSSDFY